ncbi:MAG TPA: CHAT domain-containing tetratricopeptide repeat protein, partial [Bacteroidales bacterium]|nr:CHAT domain-containing tetratricopeptide repeat protein [Bacteroidales bacterium]
DSAEFFYKKTIEMQTALFGHYSAKVASSYQNLGVVYRRLYHLRNALSAFNTAERIYKELKPNTVYLGYLYNNIGNIHFMFSDYSEAERYYEYSLDHLINLDYIDNDYFNIVYLNLFNVYIVQKKLETATKLISKVQDIKFVDNVSEEILNIHFYLGEMYFELGRLEQALEEYKKAKDYIKKYKYDDPIRIAHVNFRNATVFARLGQYEKARELLLKNLELFQNLKTVQFKTLSETYWLIGNIFYLKSDYMNSKAWLEESIRELHIKLDDAKLELTDQTSRIITSLFVDLKHLLAKTNIKLFEQKGNISLLYDANDLYGEIVEGLKINKLYMKNEDSRLQNVREKISVIHEAIDLTVKLYQTTGKQKYLDQAFLFSENTKSFVLLSEIKDIEAMKFSGLPEKVVIREEKLSNEISGYQEMLYEEKTVAEPDSVRLKTFNDKIFELKDDYNRLLDSIEHNYSNYFELKYNPDFITPKKAQSKIGKGEALVEYILSDSVLITFVVDKNDIHVLRTEINPDFHEKCHEYYSLLQKQDFSKNVHQTYKEYVRLSRLFYETLVEPVLELTKSREITFIPDAELMYLPFEAFLTKDVDEEYINYDDLPYLIYDIAVGYSYSSTLLFNERIRTRKPQNKVLAFAPTYKNLFDKNPLTWNRGSNPDFLLPLQGANEEVNYIASRVPSDTFMDSLASESNFKKHAADYSVLHLAMHTIMDDENPMYSKLAFTRNEKDTLDDNNLYTYEIYNLQLNADLVVLSSCSSGFGKMQKGEGMMSMARGFIYAGCPSIIMTLWQISDRSSSELMAHFYKHLKRGKTKKNALRQAKIDYLKKSDNLKSNPYFWSAFMVVGENTPVFKNRTPTIVLGVIIIAVTSFLIFRYYNKKKSKR